MPAPKRTARVSPSTLSRDVQGETVLVRLDSGAYYRLDAVGTRVWQLIVEKGDLDAVEAAILQEFEADRDVVSNDLRQMVHELAAKGLIEVEEK